MNKQKIIEAVEELVNAPSCNTYLKGLAQEYLAAVNTEAENEKLAKLLAQAKMDIMPIDGLIGFAGSERGVKLFGEELAGNILAHAKEIKAQGATECDCPACAACSKLVKIA